MPSNGSLKKNLVLRRYVPVTDRDAALKLAVDGFSQRRNLANRHIIKHPYFWTALLPLVAFILYRYNPVEELGSAVLFLSGIVMAGLSLVGRMTEPLQQQARDVKKSAFLDKADYAFIAVYGDEVVGVISLQFVELSDLSAPYADSNTTGAKKSKKAPVKKTHAIISSWSVTKRYRHVGLGNDLLSKTLEVAKHDKAESVLVQCSSLEVSAKKTLRKNGFENVAETKVPGHLGRVGVATETWSLYPRAWVKPESADL
ncbi:hypothetical protein V1514DRAFT_325837 [Lipomyces japonicus]|uniref:uncharacterized protein n=1 Tax=Lipomyces japonicus TaxID=56871 RepID=UPI0034CDA450